jgi:hypothetical protein
MILLFSKMAFNESIITKVRKSAHFQCCLCKALGVEVHHIVPQEEGGSDTEDNAAPLCPSCHETYGANPTKRKFIREARDLWYEICQRRYGTDLPLVQNILELVKQGASKLDIYRLKEEIIATVTSTKLSSHTIEVGKQVTTPSSKIVRILNINDMLILLYGHRSERPKSQYGLLCQEELWIEKHGLRILRNNFLDQFGEVALNALAAKTLDELAMPLHRGLYEEEIIKVLKTLSIETSLLLLVREGKISVGINADGELHFWIEPE